MFDTTLLILLGLAALGFISHNTTVAISHPRAGLSCASRR